MRRTDRTASQAEWKHILISGGVRGGQVRSGGVKSGQMRSGAFGCVQMWSSEVRWGQVRSDEVRKMSGSANVDVWWRCWWLVNNAGESG